MNGLFANPAVLTIIFGAIGATFTLFWKQFQSEKVRNRAETVRVAALHRQCELELVAVKAQVASMDKELGTVQGTCHTLTELLRKEINFGG